jgi:predicted AAA+ superfamily ATPase
MDSYWAKDIQELCRPGRRSSLLKFVELLLTSSGGIFEATRLAQPSEVSRSTIANYVSILETTVVAHVVRPYSTGKTAKIVAVPKVYGFDTGFVCYFRGWHEPRRDDMGLLWEHYVLNELHARLQTRLSIIGATNKDTKWILYSLGVANRLSRLNANGAPMILMRSPSRPLPPVIPRSNISWSPETWTGLTPSTLTHWK